jgi:predicted branched-subunit amino acid permease
MTTATLPLAARPARTDALVEGARAMAAVLVGLAPFGVVVGMASATSDTPAAAWSGTWLLYSGSAHLALVGGLADGDALPAVVAAALLVNLRLLAFSAALSPALRAQSLRFRLAAAALMVDPLWALVTGRASRSDLPRYYLGAGLVLWFGWAAAVTTGLLLGQHGALVRVAAAGVPLCMLALVLPHARSRAGAACVLAGAAAAMAPTGVPSGTSLLVSMAAGTAAAAGVRRWAA